MRLKSAQWLFTLFLPIAILLTTPDAFASIYVRPNLGYSIVLEEDSDASFTAGAAVGYQFLDHSASAEIGYARIFSDPDSDLIEATGRLGLPVLPIYAVAGVGMAQTDIAGSDWEPLYRIGAGFHLPFIPVVDIGGELSYVNFGGDTHLLQPVITVGLSF